MRRGPVPAALAAVLAFAAPSCSDGEGNDARVVRDVQPLELPDAATESASEKIEQAVLFLQSKEDKLAEPLLRQALALDPKRPEPPRLLAEILLDRRQPAAALPLLRDAVRLAPDDSGIHDQLVRCLKAMGDLSGAETACREWSVARPSDENAWYQLGTIQLESGHAKEAIQSLRRAEQSKAQRADIRAQLGLALAADGQLEKAEQKLHDALSRSGEFADAWFQLGDVIARRDPARVPEAIEAIAKAVSLRPSWTLPRLYLYRLCRIAGGAHVEMGEDNWRHILRLHGRAQLSGTGGGHAGSGEAAQSEFALREAVTEKPDDPAARVAYARFLHRERRLEEASETYRRAIELGATDGRTHAGSAAVNLSIAAERIAENVKDPARGADATTWLARAEADTAAAVTASPNEVMPRRLGAWAALLADRAADALGACDAALILDSQDALLRKCRALARMRAGEVDQGMQDLAACGWLE